MDYQEVPHHSTFTLLGVRCDTEGVFFQLECVPCKNSKAATDLQPRKRTSVSRHSLMKIDELQHWNAEPCAR